MKGLRGAGIFAVIACVLVLCAGSKLDAAGDSASEQVTTSLATDATWLTTADTTLPIAWRRPGYDDSGWQPARIVSWWRFANLLTGAGWQSRVRFIWHDHGLEFDPIPVGSVLVRKTFRLDRIPSDMTVKLAVDDDVIVWLNGIEVFRDQDGNPNHEEYVRDLSRYAQPGINVLAFQARNNGIGPNREPWAFLAAQLIVHGATATDGNGAEFLVQPTGGPQPDVSPGPSPPAPATASPGNLRSPVPEPALPAPRALSAAAAEESWKRRQEEAGQRVASAFSNAGFAPRGNLGFDPWDEALKARRRGNGRLSVVFTVDISGSMQGDKIQAAQRAMKHFVGRLDYGDDVGVVAFGDRLTTLMNLARVDGVSKNRAVAAIDGIRIEGGSDIGDGVRQSIPLLATRRSEPLIMLFTDGLTNDASAREAANRCRAQGIKITIVGIGNDANHDLLKWMAMTTGGDYYPASSFELEQAYGQAAASARGASALAQYRDVVRAGDEKDYPIYVAAANSYVEFTVTSGRSELDLTLVSPTGEILPFRTLETLDYVCAHRTPNRINIRLLKMQAGAWNVRLRGNQVPPEGDRVNILAMSRVPAKVTLIEHRRFFSRGEAPRFAVRIAGMQADKVEFKLAIPRANYESPWFPMWDDGQHDDGIAGDGIYGIALNQGFDQFLLGMFKIRATQGNPATERITITGTLQVGSDQEILANGVTLMMSEKERRDARAGAILGAIFSAVQGRYGDAFTNLVTFAQLSEDEKPIFSDKE